MCVGHKIQKKEEEKTHHDKFNIYNVTTYYLKLKRPAIEKKQKKNTWTEGSKQKKWTNVVKDTTEKE